MGVSIHYQGRIGNTALYLNLRRDLLRFAEKVKWRCLDLTGPDELQILEIVLYPPGECEPVSFLFDSQGRLHPPYEAEADGEGSEDLLWCSVKTQFAAVETHILIIELLKRIQRDYISDLQVSDEGRYWETGNLEELRFTRDRLAQKLSSFSEALSNTQNAYPEMSPEEIYDAVEEAPEEARDLEKRRLQ